MTLNTQLSKVPSTFAYLQDGYGQSKMREKLGHVGRSLFRVNYFHTTFNSFLCFGHISIISFSCDRS